MLTMILLKRRPYKSLLSSSCDVSIVLNVLENVRYNQKKILKAKIIWGIKQREAGHIAWKRLRIIPDEGNVWALFESCFEQTVLKY